MGLLQNEQYAYGIEILSKGAVFRSSKRPSPEKGAPQEKSVETFREEIRLFERSELRILGISPRFSAFCRPGLDFLPTFAAMAKVERWLHASKASYLEKTGGLPQNFFVLRQPHRYNMRQAEFCKSKSNASNKKEAATAASFL